MFLDIVSSISLLCIIPLAFLIIRWIISFRLLKGCGISGPSPQMYYGNTKQIRKLGVLKFTEVNLDTYGDVFGFYTGLQPSIVVKDLEMLKQIMVKQFDAFTDRQIIRDLLGKKSSSRASLGLLYSRGDDWKRQRKILSKSFNAVNLSRMSTLIEQSCNSLAEKFDEHADTGESFDLWKLYGLYTMEVILATGFGHKVDVINGQADKLTEASASIFAFSRGGTRLTTTTLLSNFPFLEGYVRRKTLKSEAANNYLYVEQKATELVRNRLEREEPDDYFQDLLQLLVEARAGSDDEEDGQSSVSDPYKRKLSDVEIVRISISFLLAGHDTTNNALAYVSYLLALHPEEQEKLYNEIKEFYIKKPNATLYEAAQSLSYIDMVLQESLRMFPPVPQATRYASRTVEVNGQIIPKGSIVVIPIMNIHHSPDIWPEPSTFKPSRFTKEEKEKRHPMAHMPFGWGPRSCIGMRLALMEAKMALIAIIKHFKFVEAPETEKPLKTSSGITMVPTNGVHLKVESRKWA